MEDLEFIKNFSKINIKEICENKKIDRSNVLNGRASKKNIKSVRKGIENEIAKLYIEVKNEQENITL